MVLAAKRRGRSPQRPQCHLQLQSLPLVPQQHGGGVLARRAGGGGGGRRRVGRKDGGFASRTLGGGSGGSVEGKQADAYGGADAVNAAGWQRPRPTLLCSKAFGIAVAVVHTAVKGWPPAAVGHVARYGHGSFPIRPAEERT